MTFSTYSPGDRVIYVGMKKPPKDKAGSTTQVLQIEQKILYQDNQQSQGALVDIAIAVLKTNITFSPKVNPIRIPDNVATAALTNYKGQTLTVLGYGVDQGLDPSAIFNNTNISTLNKKI
jgi:hypothetical protein